MAKHKKRKAPKNSNYRVNNPSEQGVASKSKLKEKKEKKVTGTIYFLFAFFTAVFLVYFAYNMITGNGDLNENMTKYLLPAVVCGCVSLVTFIKKI